MAITVPGYCCKCCSNQSIDSASRWLVGSSSNKISGCCNSRRHNATRRRSPPERNFTSWSSGGQRSASIARSNLLSMFHASEASMWSCNSAWRAIKDSILSGSSSTSGSPNDSFTFSYSASKSRIGCTPSCTTSFTVFLGSSLGSCSRYPTEYPGENTTSPWYDFSTPAIIFNNVDLPEPLRPIIPIFAP